MSKIIELDPRKTAPLEPWEGDDRNGSWISPFEVPTRITLLCGAGFSEIRSVVFEYAGGETGEERHTLDSKVDPAILVRSGRYTGKILELTFGEPVSLADLPLIGNRLVLGAASFQVKATALNYRMIGEIFRRWDEAVEPAG